MTVHSIAAYRGGMAAHKNDKRVLSTVIDPNESFQALMCKPDDVIASSLGVGLDDIWGLSERYKQACVDWRRGYSDAQRRK